MNKETLKNCRIAYGTTRKVFLIGRYAIKVPATVEWRLFLHGLLANAQEAIFSKTGWPELCPVIFSVPGGWLLVMKRAKTLTDDEWISMDEQEIHQFVTKPDYTVPCELKPDSFGWLDGRLVVVDYGD